VHARLEHGLSLRRGRRARQSALATLEALGQRLRDLQPDQRPFTRQLLEPRSRQTLQHEIRERPHRARAPLEEQA
jgi:hypothetical protein